MSSAAYVSGIMSLPKRARLNFTPAIFLTIDILGLELALVLAILLRVALNSVLSFQLSRSEFEGIALGLLTVPIAFYLRGLYPGYGVTSVQRLRSRTYSIILVFTLLLSWDYLVQSNKWSRGILLGTFALSLIISPVLDSILRATLTKRGWCTLPVAILGAGHTGALVAKLMRREHALGYIPRVFFDDDPEKHQTIIDGLPVAGPIESIKSLRREINTVVIAMPALAPERLSELVHELSFPNVIIIPNLVGLQSLWVNPCDVGGVLGLEIKKKLLVPSNQILKRVFDLLIGIPLLICAAPIIILSVLLIKVLDPGPAFFKHERQGSAGTSLKILKLRTMYNDADRILADYLANHDQERLLWTRYFKLKNDPRVLPGVGHLLRRFSFDELPQLWHVIRGEMSLVGPRPFPFYHLDSFSHNFRKLRCSVKPGLTGLWQVSSRSDGDLDVQQAQDTYYIRNWSMWLDLYIVARTVLVVCNGKGAY